MSKTYRYKFLNKGMKSANGDLPAWKLGEWRKHEGGLGMCSAGFHCSKGAYQAFSYVQGDTIARVEVRGKHLPDTDKECWQEMRIARAWKWTDRDSRLLACCAARLVLHIYERDYPGDNRPRLAIEALERYANHPTKRNKELMAAAWDAAWAAARDAAWDAAWAAARDAAWAAAWAAARDAVYAKLDMWMAKHIKNLKEIK